MRRVTHTLAWTLALLLALPLLLGLLLIGLANTGLGRTLIEQTTRSLTQGDVQLTGLTGRFPGQLRLAQLRIADSQGVWLEADQVRLEGWQALQLLERRVHVGELTASRVALLRAPAYGDGKSHSNNNPNAALPVTIEIERLALPRVELAAALAGNAVAVRLQAGGFYRSLQRAALQLQVTRLDQLPSTYRGSASIDAERIDAHLELAEGSGGPLAHVVGLPALGEIGVHLDLSGSRDALRTALQAQIGALQAHASGTLDLPDRSASIDLSLESQAMAPRPGLSWRHVSFQAQAHGALTAPTTSAYLQLSGLNSEAVQIDALQAQLRGEGRGLALDGMVAGLTLPAPIHALLHAAPIELHGQASLFTHGVEVQLRVAHPLLNGEAHYQWGSRGESIQASRDEPTGLFARSKARKPRSRAPSAPGPAAPSVASPAEEEGSFSATLPQVGPWLTALAGFRLEGRGVLSGQLRRVGANRRLEVSGSVDVSGGEEPYAKLLRPHAALSGALLFDGQGVQIERAQVSSVHVSTSAHGQVRDNQLQLGWQFALADLSPLSLAIPGHARGEGQLQGPLRHLGLKASADAELLLHPKVPGSVHLTLQAQDLTGRLKGRLEARGALDNAPLELEAHLERTGGGGLALTIERADWKSAHIEGSLQSAKDLLSPQGELSLQLGQLADVDALVGEPLRGDLGASLKFEGVGAQSSAQLALQAHAIGVPGKQLSSLQVQGRIEQPLRHPRFALQLSAAAPLKGVSTALSAQASGPLEALDLHAVVAVGDGAGLSRLEAAAIWSEPRRELKLTSLEARYRQQGLHLLAPARIEFAEGITLGTVRLALPPATVQLQGRLTPQLDLKVSVHDLTPALLGVALPQLQAQGRANIEAQLQGSLAAPTGTVSFVAHGLGAVSGAALGLPPGAIKLTAKLADGVADIEGTIEAGNRMQMRASGRVPLHPELPLELKLSGKTDLALLDPILEVSGQRLVGELSVEAEVTGTAAAPQARGTLSLAHVDLQDYPRGLHLSDLSMKLVAEGSRLQLQELSAHAGPGTLSATGSLDLNARGMPLQLQIVAHNAEPLRSDLLTANLNLDVRLSGALLRRELTAAGTLHINRATINIPNALPPDVQVLKVVKPGQQAASDQTLKPVIAALNLTLDAPRGVFVRGRGLNVEVGGTVHIGGSGRNPNISGGFDLLNGTFDLAGATLNFSSGRLSFNGTGLHHKIDPTLDFTATSYAGPGETATLNVGGYADAPLITLSASPNPLPQDQILAELLFGENVSQLSPLQIAGIAAALVTLTGSGGGGFNPLNTVQHALGLNRLVVSSGTPGATTANGQPSTSGATIQAGRYINSRIYVGAKQATNGLTQAQVQVDLTRKLKVQTTLSTGGGTVQGATPENDPGSSVGISYQFEY